MIDGAVTGFARIARAVGSSPTPRVSWARERELLLARGIGVVSEDAEDVDDPESDPLNSVVAYSAVAGNGRAFGGRRCPRRPVLGTR